MKILDGEANPRSTSVALVPSAGKKYSQFSIIARTSGIRRFFQPAAKVFPFEANQMGYRFTGFFVNSADMDLVVTVQERWPIIEPRPVFVPFQGYGFAFPDTEYCATEEEAEPLYEARYAAEKALPEFSHLFPTITFLWLEADCFGGTCLYGGFGCRNGEILVREEIGRDSLSRLVRILGVYPGPNNYFKPFTRGFFNLRPNSPTG